MYKTAFIFIVFFISNSAMAEYFIYSKVDDKKTCDYKKQERDKSGPGFYEFICDGPIKSIKTKFIASEHDVLYFKIDDKWYDTQHQMSEVGWFARLGNEKGIVEWVFNSKNIQNRDNLVGLIIRFNGTDENYINKSAVSVYGLKKDEICWKGNFQTNEAARKAVANKKCKEILTPFNANNWN